MALRYSRTSLSKTSEPVSALPVVARNEASKGIEPSTLLVIMAVMIVFSLSMRHMNDFFNGQATTLVKEGTWGARFRHVEAIDKPYQTRIDNAFDVMFSELEENEERMRFRSGRPLEEDWEGRVDTDD